eukprot:24553-Pleurochrysis_carterae.AAC.1
MIACARVTRLRCMCARACVGRGAWASGAKASAKASAGTRGSRMSGRWREAKPEGKGEGECVLVECWRVSGRARDGGAAIGIDGESKEGLKQIEPASKRGGAGDEEVSSSVCVPSSIILFILNRFRTGPRCTPVGGAESSPPIGNVACLTDTRNIYGSACAIAHPKCSLNPCLVISDRSQGPALPRPLLSQQFLRLHFTMNAMRIQLSSCAAIASQLRHLTRHSRFTGDKAADFT